MLSTTSLLSQIQNDLKKQKSLQGYLPSLIACLETKKRIVFSNMNDKQKLYQLQDLIREQMQKVSKSLNEQTIDLEGQESEQQQEAARQSEQLQASEQQASEQMQDQNQNAEEYSELQDKQIDEFEQPQFSKGKSTKNKSKAQQQPQIDGQQQQMIQQDDQDNSNLQQDDAKQSQEEDPQLFNQQQDVGLYGQQLNEDDEDMEDYANQFDQEEYKQFEKQFGDHEDQDLKPTRKNKKKQKSHPAQNDNVDDNIEDNFDHFRQLELDNPKQQIRPVQRTELDNQIDKIEDKIIGKKDWTMTGQVKGRQRPANSLLEFDLQFSSGIKYNHEITDERNTELQQLIKKRILSDMFDDRTRFVNSAHIREHFGSLKEVSRQKSKMGLGELYESQFKNFLGIGDNKNDKLKTQIMDSFKQLNYFLDSLTNFSFTPKPTKQMTKKGQSEAIIVQEKVPLTLWNGQKQVQKDGKLTFQSQKQVDNQAKRLKNKRIARQRKKQQLKKKLNKKIQYGGITKFQAQAKAKALMNNKPLKIDGTNMKYNKSGSFFKNMNQNKGGKPNPDISKMKI